MDAPPAAHTGFNHLPSSPDASQRLANIAHARIAVMQEHAVASGMLEPWIERSWRRCLARGQQPTDRVIFNPVSAQALRRSAESNRTLLSAATPVLAQLAQTLAATRYFAILTDAQGTAIEVQGVSPQSDPQARAIARVGVDLGENSVGTTAIGAALDERMPVWLHQGEHFFGANGVYSCAGAPIFSPQGVCAGMLDFTGVQVPERRELLSLAVHAARLIETGMLTAMPHALLLRLSWPSDAALQFGSSAMPYGLLAVDADEQIVGSDSVARSMLNLSPHHTPLRLDEVFALSSTTLWDAARQPERALDAPLWSGLRVRVQCTRRVSAGGASHDAQPALKPLKALEDSMIRQAVQDARGNVSVAAQALGISRATVYRKLGAKRRPE